MTKIKTAELVEFLGGATALSKILMCKRQNIAMWKRNGLPNKYSTRLQLDRVVKQLGHLKHSEVKQALELIWQSPDE
jgi:hypothetical protein